ncbi:MocR-like pyridoxine biosynthesis transcription factor PdxR [Salinarimonas ramus]|uniref:Transcriptional regulator n=1 Tax=Salinarimonas ramus TaxID=690164 RepID=A0A917QHN8_9HYPH|nr:PLP-dependent aminotransferase family protein [Salinarimonas ramus]GGK49587.1 transcriptional regulator [Salinarimonas ramus]
MEPAALRSLVDAAAATSEPGTIVARIFVALRDAIRAGRLAPGADLVSSRRAATALGVSRNSVNAAYELLRAEGLVTIAQGRTPVVAAIGPLPAQVAAPADAIALSRRGEILCADRRADLYSRASGAFRPGAPDEPLFPREIWARALRRAATTRLGTASEYGDYAGLPRLRRALAEHLRRERGLVASPGSVVITTGAQSSLALLAGALSDAGDRALIEDPGYLGARAAFENAGLALLPLPVDEAGADIEGAPAERANARLVYVTPSNQYPLGIRMALPRRLRLIAWARAAGGVVIEDDYDGEFHWHGQETGAMQPLAPDVVVYVGSAAKSLMPALRIGWIVAPEPLAARLASAVRNAGAAANVHAQLALASLIEEGTWKLHLRRVARAYEARARILTDAIRSRLGERVRVGLPNGGLQLAVRLRDRAAEDAALHAAGEGGFSVARLSGYALGASPVTGLLVSFADADETRAAAFAARLEGAVGQN